MATPNQQTNLETLSGRLLASGVPLRQQVDTMYAVLCVSVTVSLVCHTELSLNLLTLQDVLGSPEKANGAIADMFIARGRGAGTSSAAGGDQGGGRGGISEGRKRRASVSEVILHTSLLRMRDTHAHLLVSNESR